MLAVHQNDDIRATKGSAALPLTPIRKYFEHPRTGTSLQDVVYFTPDGCEQVDCGRIIRPGGHPRGLLYFLATGGGEEGWINPADCGALLAEIDKKREGEREKIELARLEAREMEDSLEKLNDREERTDADYESLMGGVRDSQERWASWTLF